MHPKIYKLSPAKEFEVVVIICVSLHSVRMCEVMQYENRERGINFRSWYVMSGNVQNRISNLT